MRNLNSARNAHGAWRCAINLTLIPFGLREADARFVDIYEVRKGRECGCICPSCNTPLIARQGNLNQWHFAHASRAVYGQTGNECDYSYFVSVRLMARQIIGDALELVLPPYNQRFNSANSKVARIENVQVETEFHGTTVDVCGQLDGRPFVIYFTYPGRLVPIELVSLENQKCGVVAISLERTYSLLFLERTEDTPFQEMLRVFLREDITSKRWVVHPQFNNSSPGFERSPQSHESRILTEPRRNLGNMPTPTAALEPMIVEKRDVNFQCLMCNTKWIGKEPGHNPCPKCKTHLFASRVG